MDNVIEPRKIKHNDYVIIPGKRMDGKSKKGRYIYEEESGRWKLPGVETLALNKKYEDTQIVINLPFRIVVQRGSWSRELKFELEFFPSLILFIL